MCVCVWVCVCVCVCVNLRELFNAKEIVREKNNRDVIHLITERIRKGLYFFYG